MNKSYLNDAEYRAGWDAYNSGRPRVSANGHSWVKGWEAAKADHMGLRMGNGQ